MHTLFISDLHLTPQRQDITQAFLNFMDIDAPEADAVYILGDLFEFWVGDDDNSELNNTVKAAIRQLVNKGVPCYFVQGNRDFLVGKKFTKQTKAQVLEDETLIDLYGIPTVLLHGDTLCTDDVKYQAFREKVHTPWIQFVFKLIPLHFRRKLVKKVQNEAGSEKKEKSYEIMDVNNEEVLTILRKHQAKRMIHGHTHRPNIHHLEVDGTSIDRIVLGDWYETASILKVTSKNTDLVSRPL